MTLLDRLIEAQAKGDDGEDDNIDREEVMLAENLLAIRWVRLWL